MEFPHGGHHHHHHHRRNEADQFGDEFPPPPPRFAEPPPRYPPFEQPPRVIHANHTSFSGESPPPPPRPYYGEEQPPPPAIHANHTSFYGESPPPPPRPYFEEEQPPPPVIHASHTSYAPYPPPPAGDFAYSGFLQPVDSIDYRPGPAPPPLHPASVQHVSHERHDHHSPHMPSFVHLHTHEPRNPLSDLLDRPSFRVYCKAGTDFSLSVRDGKAILAPSDHRDHHQHWVKDEKYSTRVKDKEGFPSFALVNKATGLALKHSIGDSYPVQLIPYNPDAYAFDESILWTESRDLGDGYRAIRMINNIQLNLDASHGDKRHGGIHDGTIIVLGEWKKRDNQRWRIIPYCKPFD